jgi:hypothetical protein
VRIAEGGGGDGIGGPPEGRASLAAQRAQEEPGGERRQQDPESVHPHVAAVLDLVGVKGDEKRGGERSRAPGGGPAYRSVSP